MRFPVIRHTVTGAMIDRLMALTEQMKNFHAEVLNLWHTAAQNGPDAAEKIWIEELSLRGDALDIAEDLSKLTISMGTLLGKLETSAEKRVDKEAPTS